MGRAALSVSIEEVQASTLPALRRFSEAVWERPHSEAYYEWRYQTSRPFHRVWVALRDGECLATQSAFQRPWCIGSETTDVLEVFDWYAHPDLRNVGLGVRVMQALMKEPVPLMLVGGSSDTQTLLPRLKWTSVGTAQRFVLALGAKRTAEALARRGVPAQLAGIAANAAVRRPGLRPRPRAVPRAGRVVAISRVGPELQTLYDGKVEYATYPRWTPEMLDWLLSGFAGAGLYLPLYFSVADRLVGWSLTRIYPTPLGCDAEILELFSPRQDADLYSWMLSETAARAAGHRPGLIAGQTTCEAAATGFRRNRFSPSDANPVRFWLDGREPPPGPMLVGSNTNDAPIAPMVDRWWDGGVERDG